MFFWVLDDSYIIVSDAFLWVKKCKKEPCHAFFCMLLSKKNAFYHISFACQHAKKYMTTKSICFKCHDMAWHAQGFLEKSRDIECNAKSRFRLKEIIAKDKYTPSR